MNTETQTEEIVTDETQVVTSSDDTTTTPTEENIVQTGVNQTYLENLQSVSIDTYNFVHDVSFLFLGVVIGLFCAYAFIKEAVKW